jgi:hypothetical protein
MSEQLTTTAVQLPPLDMRPIRRRHMTCLDESGHVTWAWDRKNDDQIIPAIQRMMDQGYVFWILKRDEEREGSQIFEEELEDVADLRMNRSVVIRNDDFAELVAAGVLHLDSTDDTPLQQERRTTDAREAAANDTVTHRPLRAG